MNKHPFITILTASFNNAASIAKTLSSVRNQSFHSLEHIVIDGGSSDKTLDILKAYENKYDLKWISEPDEGIADALNKGVRLARGEYIIIVHADDHLINSNICTYAYEILEAADCDVFSSPVFVVHPIKGKIIFKPIKKLWWYHFKTLFPHQGCFVHKRVFNKIGGFRKEFSIALDYDFFYRALMNQSSIKFGDKPIAIMGGEGVSNNDAFLLKRLNEEYWVQKKNEKQSFWKIAQQLFRFLYVPYKTRISPYLNTLL